MSKEDAVEGTAVPSPDMQRALYAALKEGFDAAAHALGIEPLDVRYPSSAPKAEELAFTAPAWNYDAPIDVSVEDARDKGRSAIAQISSQLANPTLSPEQRLKVSERLGNLDDAIKSGDAVAINAAIMQAQAELSESLAQAKNDEASVQLETPDQKVARLWNEIDEHEDEIARKMREAYERGEISKHEYEEWQRKQTEADRLQAYANAHPDDVYAQKAAAKAAKDSFQTAKDTGAEEVQEPADKGIRAASKLDEAIDNQQREAQNRPSNNPKSAVPNKGEEDGKSPLPFESATKEVSLEEAHSAAPSALPFAPAGPGAGRGA